MNIKNRYYAGRNFPHRWDEYSLFGKNAGGTLNAI